MQLFLAKTGFTRKPICAVLFAEYIYKHTSPINPMLENRVNRNNKVPVLKARAALTSFITEK